MAEEGCEVMGIIETIIARGPGYKSQEELTYLQYVTASTECTSYYEEWSISIYKYHDYN